MIPKKIHYIWLGGNKKSKLIEKCIASWKKYCPDYEIIEWNENNFDIGSNRYLKEAYEAKKWAFASDYIRLYVLYTEGGIYMDTDVEVLKPLGRFLECKAFSGFERKDAIPTGIMACEKGNEIFKELLSFYADKSFYNEDGSMNQTTNVVTITNTFLEKGLILNNEYQNIEGFELFPNDYFCPKDYKTKELFLTDNSYTIHHFDGSWVAPKDKFKMKVQHMLGDNITQKIVAIKKRLKK